MAPHSSTLAWKIPWMEEPGGLQSMGSLRVGNDWTTSLSLFICMHWRRKWQPTPVFLPGESQGRGAWWAAVYGVEQSRAQLKRLSSSSSYSLLTVGWQKSWPEFVHSVVTPGVRIRPLEHLDITVDKLLKIHLRRNVCPSCFLKIFHWHLLGRSRKQQHHNSQNTWQEMERKPQESQTLDGKQLWKFLNPFITFIFVWMHKSDIWFF